MNHFIGISLDDDYTGICIDDDGGGEKFIPTAVCRKNGGSAWMIGSTAYKEAIRGNGVLVDRLLSLLRKDGTATIENIKYRASELLRSFMSEILKSYMDSQLVVISIRKAEVSIMNKLHDIMMDLGFSEDRFRIISHTESFAHYVLSRDSDFYSKTVGMFELSNQCLYYYELKCSRGRKKYAVAVSRAQEEAFNLDILKNDSGARIADRILRSLAERIMDGREYSTVFLSGRGFKDMGFAENFMSYVCKRRRVCVEVSVFSIGARLYAIECFEKKESEYSIICDTRVSTDLNIKLNISDKESLFPMISAGESWFKSASEIVCIPNKQDYVEFMISPVTGMRKPLRMRMKLEGFPERPEKCSRIKISTRFKDSENLSISITDLGFGEIFPAQDITISDEINLREIYKKE